MRANKNNALPGTSIFDLRGQRFGRLVVKEYAGRNKHDYPLWDCLCDCGKEAQVAGPELKNGDASSCGCLRKESFRKMLTTHGAASRDGYGCCKAAHSRCYNPKSTSYARYGGRGIRFSDEWNWHPDVMLDDLGPRPKGYSIERINKDGNYCKENCVWASPETQANNTSWNRPLTLFGITKNMSQWERLSDLPRGLIWLRLQAKWSTEEAILTPANATKPYALSAQGFVNGAGI